jgi:hypothetical protein
LDLKLSSEFGPRLIPTNRNDAVPVHFVVPLRPLEPRAQQSERFDVAHRVRAAQRPPDQIEKRVLMPRRLITFSQLDTNPTGGRKSLDRETETPNVVNYTKSSGVDIREYEAED